MAIVRILHVLHSMNRGGAENAIMNYYRHIDRDKLQFDFLLTEQNKCHFEDEINSLGGKIYRVPLLRMGNPLPYIKSVSAFFNEHPEYQIVHSHTSSKSVFPLWIAKKKGVPVRIAHSHSSQSEIGINGRVRDCLKIPLKSVANHYLACGTEAAIWLYGKKYHEKGKIQIFPNVIECKKFVYDTNIREEYRRKLGISNDTILLGCTARFCYPKNQTFAVDVLIELRKKNINSMLLLVGDGEERPMLESNISKSGLGDFVIFSGVVPNVSDYEQAMDVFLMPSFFEGLPLSLIEAQISGLKCFASTGVPQEADKTGLVSFIPLDKGPRYWSEQIVHQIPYTRRSFLHEMQEAGYDAETSAKKLQDYYLHLIQKI